MPIMRQTAETSYAALLQQAEAWRARWGSANPLSKHPRLKVPAGWAARAAGSRPSRCVSMPRRGATEPQDPI